MKILFRIAAAFLAFAVCCYPGCNNPGNTSGSSPRNLSDLTNALASPNFDERCAVTEHFWELGSSRKLTDPEIHVMLPAINSDPDWRIKVRCIQNLPFAANKELVVPVLISALSIRDATLDGDGNVQLYSCIALAMIGDRRGLDPMREWLVYLEANPNIYPPTRKILLEQTQARIQQLEGTMRR